MAPVCIHKVDCLYKVFFLLNSLYAYKVLNAFACRDPHYVTVLVWG